MHVNKIPILSGVSIAENGRIISSALPYDEVSNRGICSHNWIGAFFARIFGSGTLTVSIENEEVYLNQGSCSGFLRAHKVEFDPSNKEDLIAKVQNVFFLQAKLQSVREHNQKIHAQNEKIYSDIAMPEAMKEMMRGINRKLAESNEKTVFDEAKQIGISIEPQAEIEKPKSNKELLLSQLEYIRQTSPQETRQRLESNVFDHAKRLGIDLLF